MDRSKLLGALLPVAAVALGIVLVEGAYSLAHGSRAQVPLIHRIFWRLAGPPDSEPGSRVISHPEQIERLLDALLHDRVGIGNSPYEELKTPETRVNLDLDGCWSQKPDQRKTLQFLRSNLFNPFDPLTAFYDRHRELSPEVRELLERHGFGAVDHTTNEHGERLTLPAIEARRIVLVAGDSVANGILLDDEDTLASRLQARDEARRYANLGVSGARTSDILCQLERAAGRYEGRVEELVYVFTENDLRDDDVVDAASELVPRLTTFAEREGIGNVVFVYVPYIYNAVPETTRVRGHSHYDWPTFHEKKRRLLSEAEAAGFRVFDFLEISDRVQRQEGTLFAPLALYLDHAHLSRRGTRLLADEVATRLRQPQAGDRPGQRWKRRRFGTSSVRRRSLSSPSSS